MLNTTVIDAFTKKYAGTYRYTTTVRHKGTVIAFAMDSQQIFYTVLDLSGTSRRDTTDATNSKNPLDVNYWQASPQPLRFPNEIAEVGYGVTDQSLLPVFRKGSSIPEKPGTNLKPNEKDAFLSTTARLTADAPFQVLSDGQFIYVFRQAIADPTSYTDAAAQTAARKAMLFVDPDGHVITSSDGSEANLGFTDKTGTFVTRSASAISAIVNATLLVDRFVLSGTQLQTKMEVRFQRSRSKTRPQSRKDGLGAKDLDGNPFLEPTQELKFVGHLAGGRFAVVLVPTAVQEIQRWQIFAHNSKTGLVDLFDVERSTDGLFNTRGSQVYTCVDHPEVFAQKAGKCIEPSLGDPSQPCDKDLIPRVSTEGYAESALRPKTLDELNAEVERALDRQGQTILQSQGSFSTVAEPYISLGTGVKLGTVFTQEAWIAPLASSTLPQALITSHGDKPGGSLEASRADPTACPSIWIEAGSRVRVGFGSGNQWNECATRGLLTSKSWNHLAVTFDGTAYRFYVNGRLHEKIDQVSVYINGILQQNADETPKLEPIAGKQLPDMPVTFLGALQTSFNGSIDEIRLWSRVRSEQELRSSLYQRLIGQETRLVGYWRFDEATGSTVYDQTDNQVNGTLHGTVTWRTSPEVGTPVILQLDGWQWVASDAPLGESLGVSRSSFRFASGTAAGAIEPRSVESGLTVLLYYQQEKVTSGYAAEDKPLKRNARVMLAVATKNASGDKNEIATLDFAVSASGKLAQVPDVIPLSVMNAPDATGQSINQKLEQASGLQEQIRILNEGITNLDRLIDELKPPLGIIGILNAAVADPTVSSPAIADPDLSYLNAKLSKLKDGAKDLTKKDDAVKALETKVIQAVAAFYEHADFQGYGFAITPAILGGEQLKKEGKAYISSLKLPDELQATVYTGENRDGTSAIFKGEVRYVGDNWNDNILSMVIAENPAYTHQARSELDAAKTAFDSAQNDVTDARDRLQVRMQAYVNDRQDKRNQLDTAQTELQTLQSVLQSGVEVPMNLVHTDPFGLTISGGLLGFAWTKDTPFLFDSATGSLALYFRGTDDQFFVAYYKTLTERATYPLVDQNSKEQVVCIARSTDLEMDKLTIAVNSSTTADTCTVTITGAGIEETWDQVPRTPEQFAQVLNGQAGKREYVGSGSIVTELGEVKSLTIPDGIRRSLLIGATLFVGKTKVTVQQTVATGATSAAISSTAIPVPTDKLPLFFVEYDYAANVQTTKVPNDLYNGSLLVRAAAQGAIDATSKIQIGQRVTSGATLSCKWTAAAPGSTLAFDGVDDIAVLANAATLKQFEAPRNVTLEAWVRPNRSGDKARVIQHYQSDSANYTLGLQAKDLMSALAFDGNASIDLGQGVCVGNRFTQEAWIYPSPTDDNFHGFLGNDPGNGVQRSPSLWIYQKTHIHAGFGDGQAFLGFSTYKDASSPPVLVLNAWNHVAVTFDGTAYKLYVNGTLKFETTALSDKVPVNTPVKFIGRVDNFFLGRIDDVRLWKRARTQAEIQADMNRQLGGSETDLVGYWHFEHGTAKDYSRYHNDGQIAGTTTSAVSALPAYSAFAGVNNQFMQAPETFSGGNWTHLAAAFRQSYGLQFDGLGGYLDCGNDTTLDISRDLTIEVFLQVQDLSRGNSILNRGRFADGTTEQDVPYALYIAPDGRVRFAFQDIAHKAHFLSKDNRGQDEATPWFQSNRSIGTTFCKIAVTRMRNKAETPIKDSKGNTIGAKVNAWDEITFYIDGTNAGSFKYESTQDESDNLRQPVDVGSSNQSLEIGLGFTTSTNISVANTAQTLPITIAPFRGTISEVRIWNTAREQSNIARDLKGNEKGLVSWWQFEENDGNTAFDSKSHNHATINGTVNWVKDPNPQGSKLTLYRNGAPLTANAVNADPFKTSEPQFTLAACRRNSNTQEYLQGELEELRIWKTTRTQEQIQDNLFRRLLGEQEDLIAYYTFDLDSDQARQALSTLYDRSLQGNDLTITGATYILSTAPISDDAPAVRSALAGVKTTFHGLIQSQPGVQEYGDLQYDIDNNLIGVFKRCYSFIKDGQWQLLTSFKVGDLVTEWIGQMQTAPQLIGYIEGAPPVPSENLTATGYVLGEFADYTGASSVELSQAQSTTYTYSASKEEGVDFTFDMKLGGVLGAKASAGFGLVVETVDVENVVGLHLNLDSSFGWLNDASTGVGRTTTGATKMELRGYVENADAIAYPNMGRRFVPDNMGMALVKSETADIFALRLKHNQALVSFQIRPNPDIPPDRNIITFPLNPRYVKQGTLDGKIGVLDVDPDYPNAFTYNPDSSYFKPIEAYAFKDQINRQEVELQTYYEQYKASERGRRSAGLYGGDDDLASGEMLKKLPHLQKRNLVNSYVWTAAGGLFAETQESMDLYQEQSGGSYAFKGMAGLYTDLTLAFAGVGLKLELDAMLGGHLNLTVTKSQESQTTFGLNVDIDKVENDIYLRNDKGEMIMDQSTVSDSSDPHAIRKWKPRLMPGRVDAYRFMTFYLEPKSDHFDLFFNRVVDPIWLEQSDAPSAVALREARQVKNNCWRIMHRVTYVSRILPPLSDPAPSSLEKTLQTLDIDSNYELIKQLEPFVSNKLTSYPEFAEAIRGTITLYLPELQSHSQEIIQYMSLYFGIVDTQELPGQDAELVDAPRTINQPPIVNAGIDQTIGLDGPIITAALEGTAIDDRVNQSNALFVTWEKVAGEGEVTFADSHALTTTATFAQRGKYVLRLTADDGSLSASDTLTIVVNQRPVISAGADQQVKPRLDAGQASPTLEAQLTGLLLDSGLGDPEHSVVTVKWAKQSRLGEVRFSDSKALATKARFDTSGNYVLKLTVDNGTFTADDEMLVAVAARTTDQLQVLYTFEARDGAIVPDVSGVGTLLKPPDPLDLTISNRTAITWERGGLTIRVPSILATTGSAARLTQAVKASNEVTVEAWLKPSILNHEGLARIVTLSDGPGKRSIILGQSDNRYYVAIRTTTTNANASNKALIAGTVSTTDITHLVCTRTASGLVRLYLDGKEIGSREVSGGLSGWDDTFKLALGNELGVNPGNDRAWLGEYHLVAIYSRALSLEEVLQNFEFGADTNLPPVISAGTDQVINWPDGQLLPILAQLTGCATHDREPQSATITWTQVGGPGTPNGVMLTNENALSTEVKFTQNGRYVLRLTVDDGELMASDEVAITVNQPPTFTAQAEPSLALSGESVTARLKGAIQNTGLGDAGAPTTTWSRIGGPTTLKIATRNQLETTATFIDRGVYKLELEVNNGLFYKKAPVTITVHQAPSVRAGESQIVTLPTLAEVATAAAVQAQVTLAGEVRDSGLGNPQQGGLLFKWEQVSGPGQVVFADATQQSTTATFTAGGLYVLRFTATNPDISSLASSADVSITVNQRPLVHAGFDQTIQLPAEIELDATVSDDGLPTVPGALTLKWEQVSGEGAVTFSDAASSYTKAKFSKGGTYVLRLTGNDGVAQSSDAVTVVAKAPPRVTRELLALYPCEENGGTTVNDVSGVEPRLNLACTHGATLAGGVLTLNSPTIVASTAAATKLIVQAKAKPKNKHAITIEAWVKPKNINPIQSLPARIVTLSADQQNRNFTLGQENGTYVVRLRTKSDDLNGNNNAFSAGVVATNRVSHLVYTWSATSQIARFYQDGVEVGKKTGVSGDFSVWNDNYKLAIANEFNNQPRAWLGEVHLVAIYNTALTPDEVSQNFAAGSAPQ